MYLNKLPRFFLLALTAVLCATSSASAGTIDVTYSPEITDSYTGRVYLMFTQGWGQPRFGPSWFNTEPFFAVDVDQWKPGEPLTFDDNAHSFPKPLSKLSKSDWNVQAVMRLNQNSPMLGAGIGNAYSKKQSIVIPDQSADSIVLTIDRVTKAPSLPATDNWSMAELPSPLLSAFYKRPIKMRAIVLLPEGYEMSGDRHYPTLYWVGGFGSDHLSAFQFSNVWSNTPGSDGIIRVVLDPLCYGGHHVFADSANNGPRAKALIEEFIPYLERTYRVDPHPEARFLSGVSSGGWSTLWLQVMYPDSFGGVWSLCPDPVDFRAFQQVNLYAPDANLFLASDGQRAALAHEGEVQLIYTDDFMAVENVLVDGGQLRSFEWVFSPRGKDGKPLRIADPLTGVINSEVAEEWKKYDIQEYVLKNWSQLKERLANKITIIVGSEDTFYLDAAVILLAETFATLGADAKVEVLEGEDHSSFINKRLFDRIDRELLDRYNAQQLSSPENN